VRLIWFKRLALLVLLLLALAAAAIGIYVFRTFPALDGELSTPGLSSSVEVSRDGSDVTHIKAASPHDAWFSLGYLHAQERGWQIEFNRRVMHGELSEVIGPATLETDKLLRTLGIMQAAEQQWRGMPAEGRDALQAYSDGITAFYTGSSQALSPEFHILGVQPGGKSGRYWTPQDAIGWSLMMALDLGGNWGTEFARLTAAKKVDTATLWQLFPPYPGEQPASATDFSTLYANMGLYRNAVPAATKKVAEIAYDHLAGDTFDAKEHLKTALLMASNINQWANTLGVVDGKGSNSWVVAGNRTESGKPLLANDPHLGLSAPAIWYFAHLQAPAVKGMDGQTTAAIDAIGATLPGLPFVVLGHTQEAAWTFTNTAPDVQDLYIEQINPADPNEYRVPTSSSVPAWASFKVREETIHVKGQPDVKVAVRESRHGPVLSDVQKSHADLIDTSKYVIALRWAALDDDNQTVLAGLRANQARSVGDVLAAFSVYHSPMQNLVAADTQGGMAFKAIGKVPLRKPGNDIRGIAPSPGWDARYDWDGWMTYAQTPQADQAAINVKGWWATANERITPPGYPMFMGQDWTVPYRHDRIEQLLAASPKHNVASMQKIQGDQLSPAALKLLPYLLDAAKASKHPLAVQAQEALTGFDGVMRANAAAPLVFAAWADELTRGLLTAKLGPELFRTLYGKRHFRATVEDVMLRNDLRWCGSAGCASQSQAALGRALDRLLGDYGNDVAKWTWGRAHVALSEHRPFDKVPSLAQFFDVVVPTGGDTFTINVGQYWAVDGQTSFTSRQAASLRAVYDLANLENSGFIYQTGQSGLVFSSRYRDMRDSWASVGYRPLQMRPSITRHQLTLNP
jgi:penicillin amidase